MRRWLRSCGILLWSGAGLLAAGCGSAPARATAAPPACVTVYSFHLQAPYVVPGATADGITQRLMERLNGARPGGRCYSLVLLPAPEMNARLRRNEDGLILWANRDRGQNIRADLRSTEPLFWDSVVVMSRQDQPLEYQSLADLYGRSVAIPEGAYVRGVFEAAAAGHLRVVPGTPSDNLRRLLAGEVDVVLMVTSLYRHLRSSLPMNAVHVAATPQDAFGRSIVYPPSLAGLAGPLEAFIRQLKQDAGWSGELARFDLEGLVSPQYLNLDQLIEFEVDPAPQPPN